MLIVPFLLNGFRMIEDIISQEFVVLLCIGKKSVMEVCVLFLIAIFLMILIVIPPAAPASVIYFFISRSWGSNAWNLCNNHPKVWREMWHCNLIFSILALLFHCCSRALLVRYVYWVVFSRVYWEEQKQNKDSKGFFGYSHCRDVWRQFLLRSFISNWVQCDTQC